MMKLSSAPLVSISIYNEAQCPGCIDYSKTQLAAVMSKIPSIVSLLVFPFGNANETVVDGTFSFSCQHGYNEYVSNMYEACAERHFPDTNDDNIPAWYPFFACIEESTLATDRVPIPYNFSIVEGCANEANLEYGVLQDCVSDHAEVGAAADGNLIMHEVAKATTASGKTFCLWVDVEGYGVLTEEQIDNGDDLVKIICDAYTGGDKPEGCN